MTENVWIDLGRVHVASKMLWVGDPAYILDDRWSDESYKSLGMDFADFEDMIRPNLNKDGFHSLEFDSGSDGLAIVVPTSFNKANIKLLIVDNKPKEIRILLDE